MPAHRADLRHRPTPFVFRIDAKAMPVVVAALRSRLLLLGAGLQTQLWAACQGGGCLG
jgi:hypothetical protein